MSNSNKIAHTIIGLGEGVFSEAVSLISSIVEVLASGDNSQSEYREAVIRVNNLKAELDSIQSKETDSDSNILSSIEELKNIKKQAETLSSLIEVNKALVKGIKQNVKKSGDLITDEVQGSVFGIITEAKLKEVLLNQMKKSIEEDGPYSVIEQCISAVNDNVKYTNIILQGILKLQLITMIKLLDLTEVDVATSKRIHEIALRLENSNTNLSELIDYSLEASEMVDYCNQKSKNLEAQLEQLTKEHESLKAEIEILKSTVPSHGHSNWLDRLLSFFSGR